MVYFLFMSGIITMIDYLFVGYTYDILNMVSFTAIFCGVFVLIKKNPIESLMALIGLFASISVYLFFVGLSFIAFSYLIVYIGAVSILFIFILMLIDIRTSELQSYNWNIIPLGILISLVLHYGLSSILPYYITIIPNDKYTYDNNLINKLIGSGNMVYLNIKTTIHNLFVMYTSSFSWDTSMTEINHAATIGNVIYTTHNIWLFIAGLILLLVMIGAIIITVTQNTDTKKRF